MSLNDTPSGERIHIGFFGRRNAGKSSVVNAVTGQDLSVVSRIEGTTTDPVKKAMELLPLGPVVIIDTPGFDDEGTLGELRVQRTRKILAQTDLAVLVVDGSGGMCACDRELLALFSENRIPYIICRNKSDLICRNRPDLICGNRSDLNDRNKSDLICRNKSDLICGNRPDLGGDKSPARGDGADACPSGSGAELIMHENVGGGPEPADDRLGHDRQEANYGTLRRAPESRATAAKTCCRGEPVIEVSAKTGDGIHELKEKIGALYQAQKALRGDGAEPRLVSDLVSPGGQVILVIPIDKAAPKGRLILPQQQVIRDILDARCSAVCIQEDGVRAALENLRTPPALVVTDSQVFSSVQKDVPEDIPLTSFSILMARYKGFLEAAVMGASRIDRLRDGDRVLIAEGCTHHRQCDDIGTVKLPRWLHARTGREIRIETSSGTGFPEDLTPYALVIHCGGCMLNAREVQNRIARAVSQGVPVTNYGTAIAYMNGILRRSVAMFPGLAAKLDGV